MYLRDLINKLIDELEVNGNHRVLIEYNPDVDRDVEGVRVVPYSKDERITYYITNNLQIKFNII